MDWKKVVIYSMCMMCMNCVSFYHHPKGGFRPKKPKFSLSKQSFYYSSLIDTSAIYVNIDTLKYDEYKSVFYLKFYNNGRYFKSSESYKKKITKHNLYPTFIGYYNLNRNKIQTEYFFVDLYNRWGSKYIKQKGFIKNDTIFLNNPIIPKDKDIYVKQKLNFIPKTSNW